MLSCYRDQFFKALSYSLTFIFSPTHIKNRTENSPLQKDKREGEGVKEQKNDSPSECLLLFRLRCCFNNII